MRNAILSTAFLSMCTGCGSGRALPTAKVAATTPVLGTTTIDFAVTRRGEERTHSIIEGRSVLGSSSMRFETSDHDRKLNAKLVLSAQPHEDGTMDLFASYDEKTEQREIRWGPAIHLARGATAVVGINGDGFDRQLRVHAE
jgi:hypothetical protein